MNPAIDRSVLLDVPSFRPVDGVLERDWLALWERLDAAPWLHPAWSRIWWQAFGRGRPSIGCVHRGDRLVAVVPTIVRGADRTAMANQESPGFSILAQDPAAVRVAAAALFDGAHRLNLFPMWADADDSTEVAAEARRRRYLVLERPVGSSPFILVSPDAKHDAELSAKLRREIRRRWKRLADEGSLSIAVARDPSWAADALERAFGIEDAGWKGRAGTAIAAREDATRFYRSLVAWAAEQGWLLLAELRVGDTTIAFDLSLELCGVHYLLKTSFDPEWGRFAPGTLLRDAMLARAFALRLRRYEFLGKDDEWKREWTAAGHPKVQIRAFPPTPSGALARLRWGAGWAIRDRLVTR